MIKHLKVRRRKAPCVRVKLIDTDSEQYWKRTEPDVKHIVSNSSFP